MALRLGLLALSAQAMSGAVHAENWQIEPRLSVAETYTDNVGREPSGQENDDLITQLIPGVHINKAGGRLRVIGDYQAQALLFANDGDRNSVYHRLNAKADADIVEDWLFFDLGASISQAIIDAEQRLLLDNFSGKSNRGNVVTLAASPYLKHDFGGIVAVDLRYAFQKTRFSRGAKDSRIDKLTAQLGNGRRLSPLRWGINYRKEDVDRDTLVDPSFESLQGDVSYLLGRGFSLLARAGREDNAFNSRRSVTNGSYWSAGLGWANRFLSLQAMKGNNYQSVALGLTPSVRTSLNISFRDRSVGVNPGTVWSGNFQHRTRRSNWSARYFEDTITVQQIQLESANAAILSMTLQDVIDLEQGILAGGGLPFYDENLNLFSLTDSVIERKRGSASVSYRLARTTFSLSAYDEERDLLASGEQQKARGGVAAVRWRYGARTSTLLRYGRQNADFLPSGTANDLSYWLLTLTYQLGAKATGSVEFRTTEQDSSNLSNNYDENRLTLRLQVTF
ncbi:TIGR03016 family PEP-CTERM system-associated outer membrane protein [Thiohalobacter sp. IOR34]|uniref:TIGR03016 family PEP-CTERM system-associated outer membrane protein n=1 Tax=Thiohalobacter sp. IOR34 TaxID=3057176 RepID=UPI0025B0BD3A|nr:TIGR03016 family PEP-CTERM system-associated outer membrane protein [Thiohalobacter sp. IOR34]WJW74464.1 TIGR03016 family PEP-CTERM system-associated outer membrane protein [Thiohalobacter sp. IOR34]